MTIRDLLSTVLEAAVVVSVAPVVAVVAFGRAEGLG